MTATMRPLTTVLLGNAVRASLQVRDPVTKAPPDVADVINLDVVVRDEAGVALDATVDTLDTPGDFVIRFLPVAPGDYYLHVTVSGAFDATAEGRVAVERSRMPAGA